MFRAVITKALRQHSSASLKSTSNNIIFTPKQCAYSTTYLKSNLEEAPEKYTAFEKSYAEWKYVEKLMPPEYVPKVTVDPSVDFPSGWRAPNPPKDCEYMIHRTKNHMIPVYLHISYRGERRNTRIKNVDGNIWKLEKDIGEYLQTKYRVNVITHVNEPARTVHIRGDKVDHVREWVIQQGF